MIIKNPDDKQPEIAHLQNLLNHPSADAATKRRIEQEIRNIQAGIRGEAEAAYEMKVHFGDSANWMIIHDLRIEHGGLVAQIDHLILNRLLEMWVCESKHFAEGVAINEHGEFAAFFGNKPYGVPSPIEQNSRHILILKRLFESGAVRLPTRLGFIIKPDLKGLVLVSKRARISRPKAKIGDLDAIIKNDMLSTTIYKQFDDASPLRIAKAVSSDTIENLAREITQLHKPIEFNWNAKFGLADLVDQPVKSAPALVLTGPTDNTQKARQKLICSSCGDPVSYNVAKFCWTNKTRFGGNIYCIDCQKKEPGPRSSTPTQA